MSHYRSKRFCGFDLPYAPPALFQHLPEWPEGQESDSMKTTQPAAESAPRACVCVCVCVFRLWDESSAVCGPERVFWMQSKEEMKALSSNGPSLTHKQTHSSIPSLCRLAKEKEKVVHMQAQTLLLRLVVISHLRGGERHLQREFGVCCGADQDGSLGNRALYLILLLCQLL